jgi:hypothetical protein
VNKFEEKESSATHHSVSQKLTQRKFRNGNNSLSQDYMADQSSYDTKYKQSCHKDEVSIIILNSTGFFLSWIKETRRV